MLWNKNLHNRLPTTDYLSPDSQSEIKNDFISASRIYELRGGTAPERNFPIPCAPGISEQLASISDFREIRPELPDLASSEIEPRPSIELIESEVGRSEIGNAISKPIDMK